VVRIDIGLETVGVGVRNASQSFEDLLSLLSSKAVDNGHIEARQPLF
jgi:hypothetical protein